MNIFSQPEISEKILGIKELNLNAKDIFDIEEHQGGLVNYVFKISTAKGDFYLKQFLKEPKADVFKGININFEGRINLSYSVETIFENIIGRDEHIIPQIYDHNQSEGYLIIEGFKNVRSLINEFSSGNFSDYFIVKLGEVIGKIHQETYGKYNTKELFNDQWLSLKLKYQYYDVAKFVSEENAQKIIKLVDGYKNNRLVLVHGDLCSINILLGENKDFHLIDFEDAHIGTPAFDLGYFLSEYFIAAVHYQDQKENIKKTIKDFLEAYFTLFHQQTRLVVEKETSLHLASLILYRVFGISKDTFTSYVSESSRKKAKEIVEYILNNQEQPVSYFIEKL